MNLMIFGQPLIKEVLAGEHDLGPPLRGVGKLGTGKVLTEPAVGFASVFSLIIGFMSVAAIVWIVFSIISAGYEWMAAGGDSQKVEQAQKKITSSFIGLLRVMGAVVIVSLSGNVLFGIDILNLKSLVGNLAI